MWDLQSVYRWVFLATLPFTLFYIALGGISGLLLADYEHKLYYASLIHYDHNVIYAKQYWKPGEHDGGVGPYWIPQLRDPSNWWVKLGLSRFDATPILGEEDTPIDQLAWLNTLYRRTDEDKEGKCWHHWIYVSDHYLYYDGMGLDVWDSAFNELLQYRYANPAPCNAKFHYISCTSSFLCDIWKTRGPALIHFTTEAAHSQENREAVPGYTPVTARIVEFPITTATEMSLVPGVFPTPFNQMKSITSDPYIWQEHVPWSIQYQLKVRLEEIVELKSRDYPGSFGRIIQLDNWISKNVLDPLGLEMPRAAILSIGVLTTFLGSRLIETAGDIISGFLAEDSDMGEPTMRKREASFMTQTVRDFFDTNHDLVLERKLAKMNEESKMSSNIRNIVRKGSESKQDEGTNDENLEVKAI